MTMMHVLTGLAAALGLAACAAGGPPPKRPVVAVADQAGAIDRALLANTWQCRELNPLPGAPAQTTTISYRPDGTFASEARTIAGPNAPPPMRVTATGNWRTEGDRLVNSNVRAQAGSADGNPMMSVLAGLGASIVNTYMAGRDGASEVLKLTSGELITRPMEVEDPPIIACTR